MMYPILSIALLVSFHTPAALAAPETDARVTTALNLLEQTKTGKEQLEHARELKVPIQIGRVSRTDITATRSMKGEQETFSFQSNVILAEGKDPVFQALDLSHELVHATHPKSNPFDPNLNLESYVKHGIEGDGGEAQAIATECRTASEMIEQNEKANFLKPDTVQLMKARCHFVWNTVARESKWKQSFYHLGEHYREFMTALSGLNLKEEERANWRDRVEAKSTLFSSAVAHKPYPLALLEEYVEVTKKVCDRTRSNKIGRALASLPLLESRCQAVGASLHP